MEKRMNKQELIELIQSLKINKEEFWILSSGALVIRGIYPDAGDLDIAVTEKGLQQLQEKYDLTKKETGWYKVNDKVECILDTKESWKIEKIEGYNLQSIEMYYELLKGSNREKDKARIPLVEKYMRNKEDINYAKKARLNAYSPYSNFQVGAALRTKSGKVYLGCNVENQGIQAICAERTAFVKALSDGEREFESITVVGANKGEEPKEKCMPCGYCRQFMSEFVDANFKVCVLDNANIEELTINELLPHSFSL